ncbi:hypothetical protein F2P56_004997 [Juglans regia]|uniref:Phospholipid:diacylglycerol acyltransferase 1-like n=2 Tax=Juglans regia TaxID=51240 RepID=A0A833Y8Q9_JUGRE|nr:phospholipid:diacylglycerol acyltransferase 1-like isoform X2 [Juglans regia]KAF5478437.1 hypothetical protein F2P56_004997 [Juglans regia]
MAFCLSMSMAFSRPLCWVEHISLDNETGLDPSGIRLRSVSGLVAADYFAPGYFVWAVLIANLALIGYEEKTMYIAAYDWRLSFQNTEPTSKQGIFEDATQGSEPGKTIALYVLDALVCIDHERYFLSQLQSRGFLRSCFMSISNVSYEGKCIS